MLVALLPRVVDLEAFGALALDCLRDDDARARLAARVGWLNLLCPSDLPGLVHFDLDLRRPDEWRVARALARMSIDEDGQNFRPPEPYRDLSRRWHRMGGDVPTVPCALFRRNHGTAWIAGWELPLNWDEANYTGNGTKGVPHEGQLIIDYSSRARDGCGPNAATRAAVTKGFFLCAMPRPSEPHPPDA